jgi:hypothetical protein
MITTVTRKIWREAGALTGRPLGQYFDAGIKLRANPRFVRYYDCEYVAEPSAFQQIEAHTELGGYAIALRDGVLYQVFTEQDGPGFAELWSGVTYHMVVRITEINDGE